LDVRVRQKRVGGSARAERVTNDGVDFAGQKISFDATENCPWSKSLGDILGCEGRGYEWVDTCGQTFK
jgi:hypothetical protein